MCQHEIFLKTKCVAPEVHGGDETGSIKIKQLSVHCAQCAQHGRRGDFTSEGRREDARTEKLGRTWDALSLDR